MSLARVIERSQSDREGWKYTSLKSLAAVDFAPAVATKTANQAVPSIFAENAARHQLVFVNGAFRSDLSQIGELPFDIMTGDPQKGYRLVLKGQTCLVTTPVELMFLAENVTRATEIDVRLAVELGASGRLTLIEHYPQVPVTAPLALVNETSIHLDAQAKLVHGKLIDGGANVSHLARTTVIAAEGAYYENFNLVLGGQLVRNEIDVALAGKMAQCVLNGAMLLRDAAHADTTTHIRHLAPFCQSRENYKSVVGSKAKGVFQGKVTVEKDAQKTDSAQMHQALLLSDQAEVDAKPELRIFADDVVCSHGNAIGNLDEESLFYLRARGIDERTARGLLLRGFIDRIVDEIRVPEWRDYVKAKAEAWCDEQN